MHGSESLSIYSPQPYPCGCHRAPPPGPCHRMLTDPEAFCGVGGGSLAWSRVALGPHSSAQLSQGRLLGLQNWQKSGSHGGWGIPIPGRVVGIYSVEFCVAVLNLLLNSCVALGESLSLSGPLLPHLEHRLTISLFPDRDACSVPGLLYDRGFTWNNPAPRGH